jgi:putative ABC transport system permease protein
MWSVLIQNLRYSIRGLLKSPGFSTTAVLTLALGIGATSAIFSVVYAVFEPMPYPKPDELVMVWSTNKGNRNSVATADYLEWKDRNTCFQGLGAWTGGSFNVGAGDRPEQVPGSLRTPGFFTMEGLPFLMGRDFLPEEGHAGKDHVVILSNRLWVRQFGSNKEIIGKQIRLNGEPYTVVGVLPPGIHDRFNSQLWVPLVIEREQANREMRAVSVMGRLKDDVPIGQAQAEMAGIEQQILAERPKANPLGVAVQPLHLNFLTDATRRNLWLLLGAVGLLLLIACVNVANLLLARGASRRREVALRAALGATRKRLFSQFLTESLVLALIGGAVGVFLASTIIDFVQAVMPPVGTMLPSEANIRISIPVLIFTVAITAIAGLLFGSMPAWQATRLDLNEILKLGGRTGGGARRAPRRVLVIAEFALALTLLATGGLALKSFWNLTRIDLGIQTDHVLTFRLPALDERLKEPDQIRAYYRQMLERIGAVPGVQKVAVSSGTPGAGAEMGLRFSIAGQPLANPAERLRAALQIATPAYFDALGIRIVRGRSFDEHDNESGVRVAMVNEFFVKRFLPNVDPLTQRIVMNELKPGGGPPGKAIELQIVGVFHNVRGGGLREDAPEIDVPFWQMPWPRASIAVKTAGDPKAVVPSIASAVNSIDPDMPLAGVKTVDEIVGESLSIDRFSVVLFGSFAALGLLLAAVGIYGVTAFGVAQRTHEFGVRIALGAQRVRVIRLVLKEGTILAVTGGLIGLLGAYLVGRAMQTTLYGVPALDVRAFGAVFLLLLGAAWVACLVPAWRASRIEPLDALRHE